mmetsp:Transcript_131725/g.196288  ORF Transcript_131725/g.196288 Transcript_131725/m.196288 type:complete len:114 (-) Transcript_131725:12-353(-)
MRISVFVFALLFCIVAVSAQRNYYFQTLSSPPFRDDNDLEQPLRSTRTVIFSIDTPLFRDEYFDNFSSLDSFDDSDSVPPIGWAGPIPNFKTSDAGSVTASVALVIATFALFI